MSFTIILSWSTSEGGGFWLIATFYYFPLSRGQGTSTEHGSFHTHPLIRRVSYLTKQGSGEQPSIFNPLHISFHVDDIQTLTPLIQLAKAYAVPQIMVAASENLSPHKHMINHSVSTSCRSSGVVPALYRRKRSGGKILYKKSIDKYPYVPYDYNAMWNRFHIAPNTVSKQEISTHKF